MTFTIGRGNEVCVEAIASLAPLLIGQPLDALMARPVELFRRLTADSQLRWLGPEKGVIHLAPAAVINAVWDLWARAAGKPVWQLICEMSPEAFVACVDFRYLSDAITRTEALELLRQQAPGKQGRIEQLLDAGYPSYTTSAGWLGYSDDALRETMPRPQTPRLVALQDQGGPRPQDDLRRCRVLREEMGPEREDDDRRQSGVGCAAGDRLDGELAAVRSLVCRGADAPDDILGHAAIAQGRSHPMRVATGEMCHNRIMFKQFMQAEAMQVCQLDSCRLGGVNEVLAVLLLAARFGVPVCPHAGGVGLCEYVQHLSMIDFVCVAGTHAGRVAEYSDHLHEHLCEPVVMNNGCYMPPQAPGYSVRFTEAALSGFAWPRPAG